LTAVLISVQYTGGSLFAFFQKILWIHKEIQKQKKKGFFCINSGFAVIGTINRLVKTLHSFRLLMQREKFTFDPKYWLVCIPPQEDPDDTFSKLYK